MIEHRIPIATTDMQCPASMCPLLTKDSGSPWTGEKDASCPGHDDLENKGCPWWGMGCQGNGHVFVVDEAERQAGKSFVVGPIQPKRQDIGVSKSYDCPNASRCRWQEQSTTGLCGPREALRRGMDPKVCMY